MMRLVLDACVLFPTVMREVHEGAATAGLITPLWSERILGEWVRATEKLGPDHRATAEGEAALLRARFPDAMVAAGAPPEDAWLPDENDLHVLATAIAARADGIVTVNIRDFPTRVLARYDVLRLHPDACLLDCAAAAPVQMGAIIKAMTDKARQISGRPQAARALLKRAGLPRLGKWVSAAHPSI